MASRHGIIKILVVLLIVVILIGLGFFLSYKRIPKPSPSPKPSPYPKPTIKPSEGEELLDKIPHIYNKPKNWNGKTIIFVHGLGRSKDAWTEDMKSFEDLGYATFAFDLPFHGERGTFSGAEQLPTLIKEGSDEIVIIADFLRMDGASEVYLISRSLGSIVSAVALGKGAEIEKTVLLLPSANLRYVFKFGSVEEKPSWLDDNEVLSEIDPLYFLPNYTGRIQFHIGKKDKLLTPEAGVFAYNAAILAKERKLIWHDLSHSMPLSEYFEHAKEFFERDKVVMRASELVKGASIPSTGGNGVCDGGESWETSPFDCKEKVVLIAFQLHIEEVVERKPYDSDKALFEKYANILDRLAAVFESHGAKISIQTEKNFAIADVKFGRYILKELAERGHGIGVQSHLGHHMKRLNLDTDEERLSYTREVKEAVARAIGREPTNIGGGFEMDNINLLGNVDGGLGFISMTAVEKPYYMQTNRQPAWLHPWILPPVQMIDLSDPSWLSHNIEGNIVYIPGWYMSEGLFEIDYRKNKNCFDLATQSLYKALEDADPRFINVWWASAHLYQCGRTEEEVEEILSAYDRWLSEVVDPLVKEGKVRWMTFDEIAEFYLKWEKERFMFISALAQKSAEKSNDVLAKTNSWMRVQGLSMYLELHGHQCSFEE